MTYYLDSSVILRIVLGQPDRLPEWGGIERGVTSGLARVECLRTIDRLRLRLSLADEEVVLRREAVFRILRSLEIVELSDPVPDRASQPFPTLLGTLDALHLATALLWREQLGEELTMATHDGELANASRSCGLPVVGSS